MGRLCKRARGTSRLLLGTMPSELPNWFAHKLETVRTSAFEGVDGNVRFVVLVNDDFEHSVRGWVERDVADGTFSCHR